jgi:hypothetical protein
MLFPSLVTIGIRTVGTYIPLVPPAAVWIVIVSFYPYPACNKDTGSISNPTDVFLVLPELVVPVEEPSKSKVNCEALSVVDRINFYINSLAPSSPAPDFIFNKVLAFSGKADHI